MKWLVRSHEVCSTGEGSQNDETGSKHTGPSSSPERGRGIFLCIANKASLRRGGNSSPLKSKHRTRMRDKTLSFWRSLSVKLLFNQLEPRCQCSLPRNPGHAEMWDSSPSCVSGLHHQSRLLFSYFPSLLSAPLQPAVQSSCLRAFAITAHCRTAPSQTCLGLPPCFHLELGSKSAFQRSHHCLTHLTKSLKDTLSNTVIFYHFLKLYIFVYFMPTKTIKVIP